MQAGRRLAVATANVSLDRAYSVAPIEPNRRLSGERRRALRFEGSDELCGLRNPAESPLYGEQGGVVVDTSQAGLGRAVGQQQTGVIPEHRVAEGGLDAHAG